MDYSVTSQTGSGQGEETNKEWAMKTERGYWISNSRVIPGLEPLYSAEKITIEQKLHKCEVVTGWEVQNKFFIKDHSDQEIFHAEENSQICNRMFCGNVRAFEMGVIDKAGNEVIHFSRPLRCQGGCCQGCTCLQRLEVYIQNELYSTVEEVPTWWYPNLSVKNPSGEQIFSIKGPKWNFGCGNEVVYTIMSPDGIQEIGKIVKKWMGWLKELFTDVDDFTIEFPSNMDSVKKAALLGAVILIKYMYFEFNSQ